MTRPGAVLVVGATSSIARAISEQFASAGYEIVLAGRDTGELERTAADLRVRCSARVRVTRFDATDFVSHDALVGQAGESAPGGLGGVVVCHGYMAEQLEAENDFDLARRMIEVNYTSAVSLLERAAARFEATTPPEGTPPRFICGLSSVAGDRGRRSNYLYGSTKAAFSTYLQGLSDRLSSSGVHVLTVKAGPIDTAMTFGRRHGFLLAQPHRVAEDVYRAVVKGRNVVYTPWFWRWIMLVIRLLPDPVFKRLRL